MFMAQLKQNKKNTSTVAGKKNHNAFETTNTGDITVHTAESLLKDKLPIPILQLL